MTQIENENSKWWKTDYNTPHPILGTLMTTLEDNFNRLSFTYSIIRSFKRKYIWIGLAEFFIVCPIYFIKLQEFEKYRTKNDDGIKQRKLENLKKNIKEFIHIHDDLIKNLIVENWWNVLDQPVLGLVQDSDDQCKSGLSKIIILKIPG